MTSRHTEKVDRISRQVQRFYAQQVPFKVFHGSTNSTRIQSFEKDKMVDVSDLNEIIHLDLEAQTVIVEPNVSMDALVNTTLRRGLVPPVIPEFPGITVGGAIQGGAGESSSFKWGFFSQTTNWVEYVVGDGSVIKASPKENPDLFYGAAGSCGSLGVITGVEIKLIPAKKYVRLKYTPVANFESAVQTLAEEGKNVHDFIDCIMFTPYSGMVITGSMSNEKVGKIQRFSRARDQWYYLHVQELNNTRVAVTETVPLRDYLFRYDRGAFWVGRYAFDLFGVPFTRLRRFILNPILHTRKLYQALQESGASQQYFVQDLTVPIEKCVGFLRYVDKKIGTYPLWLCPVKPEPRSPLLCNGIAAPLTINIGIWGPRIDNYEEFKRFNRDVEKELVKYGGKKWMYAHAYYTEREFWDIYDKEWYTALRSRYHATSLPDIYSKVVVKKEYEVNVKKGLIKTILGTAGLKIEQ